MLGRRASTFREILWATAAGGLLLVASNVGCGPSDGGGGASGPPYAWGGGASSSAGGSPGATGSVGRTQQPVVVLVDADRTLTASPGGGVGVFAEYASGGHWHIWWTCDTNVNGTGAGCRFDIGLTAVGDSTIANVTGEGLGAGDGLTSGVQTVDVSTFTTTQVSGVRFDAAPGGRVQLDAQLNSARSGTFLFFVQDGAVNGNYTGTLSDPLVLDPASP